MSTAPTAIFYDDRTNLSTYAKVLVGHQSDEIDGLI